MSGSGYKEELENSLMNRLAMRNQSRQSLQVDNDYDSSDLNLKIRKDEEIEVPLINPAIKEITSEDAKLIQKATNEDIYELTTRIKVDKRRFDNDGVPKSKLNDVKFTKIESILDQSMHFSDSEFAGLFTLFWVAVAVIVINSTVNYIRENGFKAEIINILYTKIVEIALTDLWMYLSMYPILGLHYLVKKNMIDWEKSGWVISSIYELLFFITFTLFAEKQQFPWIGKIFLFLHSLVILMKIHSYSFYNGYLWRIKNELEFSKGLIKKFNEDDENLKLLHSSIEFCEFELKSQSTETPFPSNITVDNFFWFSMFPIVVYQIDFPRTERIRWSYVSEKLCAIFGVIIVMIVFAQNMMYPIVMRAIQLRGLPLMDRIYQYPLLLLNLMPSFVIIYLLVFYLIWDAILNCIAELTRFGDRDFYGPWWNCVSWDQFARIWNVPVHKFLLRHVYHSSISAFKLNKAQATIFTFFLSSVVHELSMFVLFHKIRGYLLLLQMCQLPLVMISKTKYLKDQKILGNVIFWIGIITGPSLMCTLYLTF